MIFINVPKAILRNPSLPMSYPVRRYDPFSNLRPLLGHFLGSIAHTPWNHLQKTDSQLYIFK